MRSPPEKPTASAIPMMNAIRRFFVPARCAVCVGLCAVVFLPAVVFSASAFSAAAPARGNPSPSAGAIQQANNQAESLDELCRRFSAYDHNGDQVVEIESLTPRHAAASDTPGAKRVLLLVESRLLQPLEEAVDLAPLIDRWARDLAAEGYRADVVTVQLAESDLHQDGRYLLALREFLRGVHGPDQSLAGVVLVGRFPDALLIRTCSWRKRGDITLHKGKPEQQTHRGVRYVRRVPENVADRADIVLSDLDGHWEDIYFQQRTRVPAATAVFGDAIPAHGGPVLDYEERSYVHEDFFNLSDGKLETSEWINAEGAVGGTIVSLFDTSGDHECSTDDRARSNVIAHPDILVSRLDARGIALRPRDDIVGKDGERLLDDSGQPRTVTFAEKGDVPNWRGGIWETDPILERQLLAEYLERNHAFRTGQTTVAWRPSSIACDLGSGYGVMRRAADDWQSGDGKMADLKGRPTLSNFVDWMQYPAVLRTVRAHSNAIGSQFARVDVNKLDAQLGGPAWCWTPRGDRLEPSLSAACRGGMQDWFLLRSLWENGHIAAAPAFYHHTGCNGISPPGGAKLPYNHPSYGLRQGAEALLFYGNGLSLVGRAKVFYDEPKGFAETLADGGTFGAAWQAYFEIESDAPTWGKAGGDIGRKRSYFWSVLGDWTLRLSMGRPNSRN